LQPNARESETPVMFWPSGVIAKSGPYKTLMRQSVPALEWMNSALASAVTAGEDAKKSVPTCLTRRAGAVFREETEVGQVAAKLGLDVRSHSDETHEC
jgi:hypothetical protein